MAWCSIHSDDIFNCLLNRIQSADDFFEHDNCEEHDDHVDNLSLPMLQKKSISWRKTGRWPKWNNDDVDDIIDIVVNNNYNKKLIFTNIKNQCNWEIYVKIKK